MYCRTILDIYTFIIDIVDRYSPSEYFNDSLY